MKVDAAHKSITIRQLAAIAGVSRTAVSLALRNHPSIPPDTTARIQQLANEHGYQNDTVVSALMSRLRTAKKMRGNDTLALLTSWNTRNEWRNNANDARYYEGICQRAQKLGYCVEHFWTKDPKIRNQRLSSILYTRAIRGVIIFPIPHAVGHINLDWSKFSIVTMGTVASKPVSNRVYHAHYAGMILALRELKHRGYRRIGFANLTEQDNRVGHSWLAAYLLYQHITNTLPLAPHLTDEWKSRSFAAWLKQEKPDVVISNSDAPLELLAKLNYQLPDDIGFASLDLVDKQAAHSGINQHPEEIGMAAVDLLTNQLYRHEYGIPKHPQHLQIEGTWQDGNSTRGKIKSDCHTPAKKKGKPLRVSP